MNDFSMITREKGLYFTMPIFRNCLRTAVTNAIKCRNLNAVAATDLGNRSLAAETSHLAVIRRRYDARDCTVATLTPGAGGTWLVTTNIYDGTTPRLIRTETTGQPATAYLYDALGDTVATVRSGITTASETRHENIDGTVWRVDTSSTSCGGVTNAVSTTRRQLTGLSDALRSQTVSIAPDGSATTEQSSFDPQTCELTTIRATDAATPLVTVSRFGRTVERESPRETVFNYFDQMGRAAYSEARHPAAGGSLYWRWSQYDGSGNEVDYGTDYFDHDTYEYLSVTGSRTFDAFNRETSRTDALGNTVTTAYDALGRLAATTGATYPVAYGYDTAGRMTAMHTFRDESDAGDETRWLYDHATGLLTNKVYADGSRTAHTHTPDGLPLRTIWARGAWRETGYNQQRRPVRTDYAGDTPSDFTGYDQFGAVATASNAVSSVWYIRDALGSVTNETVAVDTNVLAITRCYDRYNRISVLGPLSYAYTADGNLAVISNAGMVVEYGYTADRLDAGYTLTLANGNELSHSVVRDACRRQLVAAVTNACNGNTINQYNYTFDAVNRPTARNSDSFGYNHRSEVTSAVIDPHTASYVYDAIGNQRSNTIDFVNTEYTANNLNQYTSILGASAPLCDLSYDLDGNMLTNGVWSYTWDSANRLRTVASNGVLLVENRYDALSRRVQKITSDATHTYFYDGWNLLEERIAHTDGTSEVISYIWGKDLSGKLQGAGGVGGLLAVSLNGALYLPLYDNYGNITAYADENGTTVALYTYDAFGRTISSTGLLADIFRHRFSTKYYDIETGLYYYGYRFYAPELMRWINRDPMEEKHDIVLYGFTMNNPISTYDMLGLRTVWIQMNHHMPSLNHIPGVTRGDVNRILQECVDKHVARNKKGTPCHTVKLIWRQVSAKPEQLGFSGGNLFGYNPTFVDVYLEEWTSPLLGHTGGWHVSVNPEAVQSVSKSEGGSFEMGLATVIAHETFLHAIGGKIGHYHWSGFVDASKGLIGGNLSDSACKLLCDRLDID
jgi:RHS repeat-associated protein